MSLDRVKRMTVGELKDLLSGWPDDMPVGIGYSCGDYWCRTGVISPVKADEKVVKWSANLRTVVVDENEIGDDTEVWLILEE